MSIRRSDRRGDTGTGRRGEIVFSPPPPLSVLPRHRVLSSISHDPKSAHLDESPLGRVGLLHTRLPGGKSGLGLAGLYKEGPQFHAVVVDADGRRREDWERALLQRPLKSRRVRSEDVTSQSGWPALIRGMARHLESHGEPVAIAALVVEA